MIVGLLGDTHGNTPWTLFALDTFRKRGITTILQLGDLGIWPGTSGSDFVNEITSAMEANGQTMYVVLGNHEDMDQVAATPVSEDGWQHFSSRIMLAPRGHRWEWEGVSFVALGGAPSVDRWHRTSGPQWEGKPQTWWAAEMITQAEVDLVAAGGYADVMVCHDAPNGVKTIDLNISGNPHGFKPWDLEYAAEGRALMTQAFKAVAPRIFLHGHYHFLVEERVDTTDVLGLSCDQNNFSLGSLDTEAILDNETTTAEPWDIENDFKTYYNIE